MRRRFDKWLNIHFSDINGKGEETTALKDEFLIVFYWGGEGGVGVQNITYFPTPQKITPHDF